MIPNYPLTVPSVEDLEDGAPVSLFNHGYVRLVDRMGDDYEPAASARTSTGKGKVNPESDIRLEKRLAGDQHTSPFESVEVHIEAKLPLFVLREWDRHRTLTINETDISCEFYEVVTHDNDTRKFRSQNEMSGRYVTLPNDYYFPPAWRVVKQSKMNAQGGAEPFEEADQEAVLEALQEATAGARQVYDELIDKGVERGVARIILPLNQYTVVRIKADMLYWAKFLRLRLDVAAQYEIRMYARAVSRIMREVYPDLYPVLANAVIHATSLSREESDQLLATLTDDQKLLIPNIAKKLSSWSAD